MTDGSNNLVFNFFFFFSMHAFERVPSTQSNKISSH